MKKFKNSFFLCLLLIAMVTAPSIEILSTRKPFNHFMLVLPNSVQLDTHLSQIADESDLSYAIASTDPVDR